MAKSLGRAIRELREEAGLTRAALARAARIDPSALAHIEKDERTELRFRTVCDIAAALGSSTDEVAMRGGLLKSTKSFSRRLPRKDPQVFADIAALASSLRQAAAQLERLKRRVQRD